MSNEVKLLLNRMKVRTLVYLDEEKQDKHRLRLKRTVMLSRPMPASVHTYLLFLQY